MSKHAADTTTTTKKFLAAAGLALGVASLGLFASTGTAAARQESCSPGPCTGTYQTDPSYPAGSSHPADSSYPGTVTAGWPAMH